jgi:nicotinamide-nucleotide amidase
MFIQKFISKKLFPKLINNLDNAFLTVSTAESCTGGMIAKFLTDIPGSSKYFLGGIVSYSNEVKIQELFVNEENLEIFGAVSDVVAIEMARGCIDKFKTDFAISTTGIAGPDGDTNTKKVGLVYICVIDKNKHFKLFKYILSGDRDSVRSKASKLAIINLYRFL